MIIHDWRRAAAARVQRGRPDSVVYSPGALEVVGARLWDTESMDSGTLQGRRLTPETFKSMGRPQRVVVDFRCIS